MGDFDYDRTSTFGALLCQNLQCSTAYVPIRLIALLVFSSHNIQTCKFHMNILILGLGQYPKGSGVAAALFFAKRGDRVTVVDFYYTPAMDQNIKQLKKFKNVHFILGKHAVDQVKETDLMVRHQRIRATEPELVEAHRLNKPVESELSLFLRECPAEVIGITGTRGKSTTTTLIYEMLNLAAQNKRLVTRGERARKVWLGGNLLISPLTFLHQIKKNDVVVLEISSFQLEGMGEAGVSPHVAVWTNLMRDHLNTYSSMVEYAEAKAQIFRHQKPEDTVFLPIDRSFDAYADEAPGRVIRFGKKGSEEEGLVHAAEMKLLGEHNMRNAMIATAVALDHHVPPSMIKKVLRTFPGLPNRLEFIAIKKGVRYINDTAATTPDATMAALGALKGSPIHLIFGGADKELEFTEVAKRLKKTKHDIVLLPGTAHEKIVSAFQKACVLYQDVQDLQEAVSALCSRARKGDIILLSPGCASFGLFKNEFDRGEQFKKLIR